MKIILILILIALGFCLFWYLFKIYIIPVNTITCFTGGLGAGKSVFSFVEFKHRVKRACFIRIKRNLVIFIKNIFRSKNNKRSYFPKVQTFSSIPLCFRRFFWCKKEWSNKLTYQHLLLTQKLPPLCVVNFDEIGGFASQFEFNNPNILDNFNEFIRLFRHYTLGGYIICNDQCSDNIVLEVRRRINNVYNLCNFKKIIVIPFILSIGWVKVRNISISEEIKAIEENNKEDNYSNMFCIMPKKWNFDTYCYSIRYVSVSDKDNCLYDELKTHELLSYPKNKRIQKETK